MLQFVTLAMALGAAGAASVVPHDFPQTASYDCSLLTTNASSLCADCVFAGRHHIDAAKGYGYVTWQFGPKGSDDEFVNFMDVFHAEEQAMFMVQDTKVGPLCMQMEHTDPVFNATWAAGSEFKGYAWFDGRLCRHFANVYPYFIQGEVAVSEYYEALETNLPVAFVNKYATLIYNPNQFDTSEPDASWFTSVTELPCKKAGPGEQPGRKYLL